MNYSEALRQRQIALEHKRRADVLTPGYGVEDIDYFDDELARLDEIVNTLWLEITCS